MSKQEKVVCAAVRKWVGELEKFTLCVYYPKEYPQRSAAVGGVGYEQGFITNKNRFVDPVEARKIASNAGQVSMIVLPSLPHKIKPLKPEDLY